MIEGIGTIKKSTVRGNNTARSIRHPWRKMTRHASRKINEMRERNNSAPKTPRIKVHNENSTTARPHTDGSRFIARSLSRLTHTTYREKAGTKKPWEKFGSVHHWAASRVRT